MPFVLLGCSKTVHHGLMPSEAYALKKPMFRAAASCTDSSEYVALVCATEYAKAEALAMQKDSIDMMFSDLPAERRMGIMSQVSGTLSGYTRVRIDKFYKKGLWKIYVCVEYKGSEEELRNRLYQSVFNKLTDEEKAALKNHNQ